MSEIVEKEERDISLLMDVKVRMTVRLGTCKMPMSQVMELVPGSVIQLDQEAKDPVGLYINDKLVAYGEVVVVDDNFGIKITEMAKR